MEMRGEKYPSEGWTNFQCVEYEIFAQVDMFKHEFVKKHGSSLDCWPACSDVSLWTIRWGTAHSIFEFPDFAQEVWQVGLAERQGLPQVENNRNRLTERWDVFLTKYYLLIAANIEIHSKKNMSKTIQQVCIPKLIFLWSLPDTLGIMSRSSKVAVVAEILVCKRTQQDLRS